MLWKRKPKTPPKPRSDPYVYKKPTTHEEDERTETLRLLLGSDFDGVTLEDDNASGSDPHDNTTKLSVKRLRSK